MRWLIDDIEVTMPLNWADLEQKVSRSDEMWGLTYEVAGGSVEFGRDGADALTAIWEADGPNGDAVVKVQERDDVTLTWRTVGVYSVDFATYSRDYDRRTVTVNLGPVSAVAKLSARGDMELEYGRGTSVDGDSITSRSLITATMKARPIQYVQEWNLTTDPVTLATDIWNRNPFASIEYVPPLNGTDGNMDFANRVVLSTGQYPSSYPFGLESLFLYETATQQTGSVTYDLAFGFRQEAGPGGSSVNVDLSLVLRWYSYDGVTFTLEGSTTLETYSRNPNFTENIQWNGSANFTKEPNFLYGLFIELDQSGLAPGGRAATLAFTDVSAWGGLGYSYRCDVTFTTTEALEDTSNEGALIFECFEDVLEQITGQTNVLYSELLGRIDLGYASAGDASNIFITNGLLLRNAVLDDGSDPDLVLTFDELWQTLTACYGAGMYWDADNDRFVIETRADMFGTDALEITPAHVVQETKEDMLWTAVEVGNKKVRYENVNGNNEPNALYEFSLPIKLSRGVKLDLVTDYNTDYLGVELARRESFETEENVDTKYDDKVFLVEVQFDSGTGLWESRLGSDYNTVTGVILPNFTGNIQLSPKRMLNRNGDLLRAALYFDGTSEVRFETTDTLAQMESKLNSGDTLIVERDSVTASTLDTPAFKPILWTCEIARRDALDALKVQNRLLTFEVDGQTIEAYVWEASVNMDKAELKLLERW